MKNRAMCTFLLVAFISWAGEFALAEGPPDFSGKYTLIRSGTERKNHIEGRLAIVQSEKQIQITRFWRDEKGPSQESNTFPLDGKQADYTTESGAKGKGSVVLKGKTLILKTSVVVQPGPSQPPVEIRQTIRFKFSKDSKTLTVKTSTHFPSAPFMDMSDTDKYTRE